MSSNQVRGVNITECENKLHSKKVTRNLNNRSNKRGTFVASCVDIANTLETRLRSEVIKREEQKTLEVRYFIQWS